METIIIILIILIIALLIMILKMRKAPHPDMATAIKGIAYLKRQINELEEEVARLKRQIEKGTAPEDEKLSEIVGFIEAEFRKKGLLTPHVNVISPKTPMGTKTGEKGLRHGEGEERKLSFSGRYNEVLELAQKNMSTPQIAQLLGISQDAVNMILSTAHQSEKS